MTLDSAEALSLQALAHIIAEPTLCRRFLDLTGITPDDLRASVDDAAFLGSVLDFLLSHEKDLLEFCSASNIDPKLPARARAQLLGDAAAEWG